MAFIVLIFLTAIVISSVAAYFSIVGLGALFAATFWGVVVMAAALEVGKIVTTKWVHANWSKRSSSWLFKVFLCICIVSLMTVTSLGIYGYLSKGHLEQSAPKAGLEIQVTQLETQIKQREEENTRLQTRLDQINRITDKTLETSARQGLRASERQKREATQIQSEIDENYKEINELNEKLIPLKMQNSEVEAKLGPVKYVAELFGWKDPEVAVRMIIVLIMIAFDPLAICLFIAGSISLAEWREERKKREQSITDEPVSQELLGKIAAFEEEKKIFEEQRLEFESNKEQLQKTAIHENDRLIADRAHLNAKSETLRAKQANLEQLEKDLEERAAKLNRLERDIEAEKRIIKEQQDLLIATAEDLEKRQQEIDSWTPETIQDNRTEKQIILDMLEGNPDVLQDIIEVIGTFTTNNGDNVTPEEPTK